MDNNKKIWGLGDFRKNNYKYFSIFMPTFVINND